MSDIINSVQSLEKRIGRFEPQQIAAWRRMTPVERLEIAFQAYQFALEAVRLTERQRYPNLPEDKFNWRVIRRMQGNQKIGKEVEFGSNYSSRTG